MVDAGEPAPRARPRRAATREPLIEPSSDEDDDWVAAVDLDARQRLPKRKRPPPANADYEDLERRFAKVKRAYANFKGDANETMYALRRKLAAAEAENARLRKRLRTQSDSSE